MHALSYWLGTLAVMAAFRVAGIQPLSTQPTAWRIFCVGAIVMVPGMLIHIIDRIKADAR